MPVIAKFAVRDITSFGTGQLVELSCWCENDVMAAYAAEDQDHLFTKYSPWGEMRLHTPEHFPFGNKAEEMKPATAYYVTVLAMDEAPEIGDIDQAFPGARIFFKAVCHGVLDLGGGTRNVEYRIAKAQPNRAALGFNWKMAVDNDGASNQMHPKYDYWVAFYDAAVFTKNLAMSSALAQVDKSLEPSE